MPLRLYPPKEGRWLYWYVRGTFAGKHIYASTKTRDKKAAERFKDRLEIEIAKADAIKRQPMTLRGAAEMYKGYRQPRKTDVQYINRLLAVMGDTLLSDIRQHMLIEAANALYPNAGPGTKNRSVLVPAAAILHYAAEGGLCPYIRVRKFKEASPIPRSVSKDMARVLIAGADGKMKLAIIWLFFQGWRISDTLRLEWQQIDLKAKTVRYHISKTDTWHDMPLHDEVAAYLGTLPAGVGRVFPWTDKSNFYRSLRPLCRKLKVHFTPHMARHSFATWLANDGASPQEIMEAGGWRDHKSVLRYAKLDPTRVRKVINRIRT